jgi:hypothetical protein
MGKHRLRFAESVGRLMLRAALLLVLLAAPAAAAELRPFSEKDFCLTAHVKEGDPAGLVTIAPCVNRPDQQFRIGKLSTIYADGGRCLQVVKIEGQENNAVAAARCHGQTGQRWVLARGGQLVNDTRACLTLPSDFKSGVPVIVSACKEEDKDQTDQKWSVYGDFGK